MVELNPLLKLDQQIYISKKNKQPLFCKLNLSRTFESMKDFNFSKSVIESKQQSYFQVDI